MRYAVSRPCAVRRTIPSSPTSTSPSRLSLLRAIVTAGADDPERMVFYFATVGCDFEVLEPPEVADAVDDVAERLRRAANRP